MKKTILLFFLAHAIYSNAQDFSLCNLTITSISVSGPVSFDENGLDTSNACITLTGTADLCDRNNKVISTGLTVTVESPGCAENRLSDVGMSSNNLIIPFELLGESEAFNGKEVPIVFPNPSNGIFTLKTKNPELERAIRIVSASRGIELIATISNAENGYTIDLSNYPSGVYIISYDLNGQSFSQKVIKN